MTSAMLAIALASASRRVILIEADLRGDPSTDLGRFDRPGLADVLTGAIGSVTEVLRETTVPNLAVGGTRGSAGFDDAAELVQPDGMLKVTRGVADADFVVIGRAPCATAVGRRGYQRRPRGRRLARFRRTWDHARGDRLRAPSSSAAALKRRGRRAGWAPSARRIRRPALGPAGGPKLSDFSTSPSPGRGDGRPGGNDTRGPGRWSRRWRWRRGPSETGTRSESPSTPRRPTSTLETTSRTARPTEGASRFVRSSVGHDRPAPRRHRPRTARGAASSGGGFPAPGRQPRHPRRQVDRDDDAEAARSKAARSRRATNDASSVDEQGRIRSGCGAAPVPASSADPSGSAPRGPKHRKTQSRPPTGAVAESTAPSFLPARRSTPRPRRWLTPNPDQTSPPVRHWPSRYRRSSRRPTAGHDPGPDRSGRTRRPESRAWSTRDPPSTRPRERRPRARRQPALHRTHASLAMRRATPGGRETADGRPGGRT